MAQLVFARARHYSAERAIHWALPRISRKCQSSQQAISAQCSVHIRRFGSTSFFWLSDGLKGCMLTAQFWRMVIGSQTRRSFHCWHIQLFL